jgi:glycosyltransferase involved in cell wall biosynthesis
MLTLEPSTGTGGSRAPSAARPALAAAHARRRVLAITSNLAQASSRLRVEALIGPLAERGFELDLLACPRQWAERRDVLRSAGDYHAVLLQRKLLDPWNWRLLRRHARRVVFDVDDAVLYHPHRVGPYSRLRTTLRFRATARNVDHVVAGNDYVADLFGRRGCRQVTVLPTAIDPGRYRLKRHAPTDAPRLVWIGSRSTLPYLRRFMPALERAARLVPGLRLVTVADATVRTSASLPVEHVPWGLASEHESLCRGDIGIAPTPVDRWTLGKCGFKIVQYMAAGLPVVASPVGANAGMVRPGETGLLPARPEDWPGAIAALAADADRRRRMGLAGRALVERRYRLDDAADTWAALLAE